VAPDVAQFVRNKVAVAGGVVILLFYLVAAFAGFFPRRTQQPPRFTKDHLHAPLPRFRPLVNEGKFQPFVYGMRPSLTRTCAERTKPPVKRPSFGSLPMASRTSSWDWFPTDVHLFVGEGGKPVCLLGTDQQGRDVYPASYTAASFR